ncbi:MAG: cadherin repeat domain-containing protein [Bacteroidales bacterium]|nr:cadherin repeat domain-containing protein [Bacteroidales bacterium]
MKQKHIFPILAGMLLSTASLSAQNVLTFNSQTFTIAESLTTGSTVGNVTSVTNPENSQLAYKVVTSGVPFDFKAGTNELIIKDGSKLDYETKTTWTMKVSVSDGKLTTKGTIIVNLTDVNEAPTKLILNNEYSVDENTATGTSLGTFTVFDPDNGDKLTYSLSGALSDIFTLEETKNSNGTRTISINVKSSDLLDYEKLFIKDKGNATYQATVTVSDAAGSSVSKTTNIAVKDVNETVSIKGGTFSVNEHSPIGTYIARVEGSDLDIYSDVDVYTNNDDFNKLTYSIVQDKNSGTDYKKFTVNKNTGALYTDDEFDYESGTTQYKFIVTVSDGKFTADAQVIVNIEDVKESKPTYNSDVIIAENTPQGTTVVNVAEYVKNLNNEDINRIVGDIDIDIEQNGTFKISESKIVVDDPSKLDFETLYQKHTNTTCDVEVTVYGYDDDNNQISVPITIRITVTDVNEQPEITNTAPLSVSESATSSNTAFGNITATDPDNAYEGTHPWGFNKLTYKLDEVFEVDGSTDFPFELDPNTGAFTVAKGKRLDYTKQKQYKCKVKVMDNPKLFNDEGKLIYPSLSATKQIVINVTDENRPSVFNVLSNQYEVEENVDENTALEGKQIIVYDEDDADFDQLQITITDKNATANRDAAKLFEVVQVGKTNNTTHLSTFVIKTKADIDYEAIYNQSTSEAAFDITLTITDTKGNTTSQDTKIQVIDVNEIPAFALSEYKFNLAENTTKPTLVGTVKATDPDSHNTNFSTLYYSIEGKDATNFFIHPATGELSTLNNADFNYETKNTYQFTVVVSDKKYTVSVPITVNITDVKEAPIFVDIPDLAVDENSFKGTKVGVVTAEDEDYKNNTGKQPSYSLAATDDAANDYKSFTIDNATGTIKVNGDLNFEKQSEYFVRVIATDGDDPTLTSYIDVKIKINDVNDKPTFAQNEYIFEAHENIPLGEVIGTVIPTDEDSWSKFTYTLSDYVVDSKDADDFDIKDGKISAAAVLNYEAKKQYQLWVKSIDNGKSYGESIGRTDYNDYSTVTLVTINLIDEKEAPIIVDNGKDLYINENTIESPANTPNNHELARFKVYDEDAGQTDAPEIYLTDAGNTNADKIFEVKLTETNGGFEIILLVKDNSSFDHETLPNVHKVNICAKDPDGLESKLTKTISISDVNEPPVIAAAEFKIGENAKGGTVIGTVSATDPDIDTPEYSTLTYSLQGDESTLFTINPTTGAISTAATAVLDYETKNKYTFTVSVSDGKLSAQATITINILDEEDIVTNPEPTNPEPTNPEPQPEPEPDPQNPSTPVSSIDNGGNNVKVWSFARTIYIASTPDSQYKIIDLQGRTIATSTTKSSHEEVNINKEGIYVVIINGKSYKVSL